MWPRSLLALGVASRALQCVANDSPITDLAWSQNLSDPMNEPPLAGVVCPPTSGGSELGYDNTNLSAPCIDSRVVSVFAIISFNKLANLDVVSSTFYGDYYVYMSWRDDRFLGFASGGGTCIQDGDPIAPLLPNCARSGWLADPERMNSASSDSSVSMAGAFTVSLGSPSWVGSANGANGAWITGTARCVGLLDSMFDLRDFPFDKQTTPVTFESKTLDENKWVWAPGPNAAANAFPPGVSLDGWTTLGIDTLVQSIPCK